jgi:hypothetical protein
METNVNVTVAGEYSFEEVFAPEAPLMFVGKLLDYKKASRFTLNGVEIKVPALSETNDQKKRTFAVLMQLCKVAFPLDADSETTTIYPDDSPQAEFVNALRDKGFKIPFVSKCSAREGIRIRYAIKKAEEAEQVKATRFANIEAMQRLIVLSKSVKTIGEQLKTGLKLLGN